MAMPIWAAIAGAPKAINDVVIDPITSAYGLYKGIRDDQRQQADMEQGKADLAQFAKDPNYEPDYTKYSDPAQAEKTGTYVKGQREFKYKQEAEPVLDRFKTRYEDLAGPSTRFFADPESRQVLEESGLSLPSEQQMQNPYVSKGINDFRKTAQAESDLADVAPAILSGQAPSGDALSRFLLTGGEKSTNQLKTLQDLAKQNDEVMRARGRQGWINAGGNSPDVVIEPRLRTVMSSAPYGVTLEDLSKMTDISGVIPKWKTVDTGTGEGEQRQVLTYDERTGQAGDRIGEPWLPSAPKITNNLTYNGDKKGIESLVSKLPDYMDAAQTAYGSKVRINKMLNLIKSGAAGSQGYAKSVIAPALNLLGYETKGLSEAQLYQTLAKGMAGSLRATIVGPGPVSNYEQDLLKSVSGGGTMGAVAARELLNYYDQEADRKINTYNSTLDSVSNVAPETAKAFKRIDLKGGHNQSNGERTIVKKFVSKSTGKTKYVYSDGTEEIR